MVRQKVRDRPPRKRVDDVVTLDEEYVEQMRQAEEASSPSPPSVASEFVEQEVFHFVPDEGAYVFGEQGKAWMKVEISEDYQQATLTALSFAGQKMKRQTVVDALREIYHIKRGFKKRPWRR